MSHDYEAQRAETFESFAALGNRAALPNHAVVDFQFYPDDKDANWAACENALRAKGFRTKRFEDEDTLEASFGPIEVMPESIWHYERQATEIAIAYGFDPDGWVLAAN
ncbi:MAG: hypothetical protein U1D35_04250 [Paracoccaceae bacterium]|nr:hypothetical protein [Paracoccaceae bacterium]